MKYRPTLRKVGAVVSSVALAAALVPASALANDGALVAASDASAPLVSVEENSTLSITEVVSVAAAQELQQISLSTQSEEAVSSQAAADSAASDEAAAESASSEAAVADGASTDAVSEEQAPAGSQEAPAADVEQTEASSSSAEAVEPGAASEGAEGVQEGASEGSSEAAVADPNASQSSDSAAADSAAAANSDLAVQEGSDSASSDSASTDSSESSDSSASASSEAASADTYKVDWSSVTNGTVELVSAKTSDGKDVKNPVSGGVLSAPANSTITVKVLPARGYQLLKTSVANGKITLVPDDEEENIGYYTFKTPSENVVFDVDFTKTADVVEADSDVVVSGAVSDAETAATYGTLELDVTDLDDDAEVKGLKDAAAKLGASSSDVVASVDMSLYNIVNQGDEDMTWDTEVADLSSAITVTLKLTDSATSGASAFYIVRENNGSYQQATVTYDSSSKSITFKSNAFSSSYAIVKGTPSNNQNNNNNTNNNTTPASNTSKSSGSTTPKTGDTNDALPFALLAGISGITALVAVRRVREV